MNSWKADVKCIILIIMYMLYTPYNAYFNEILFLFTI